MSLYHFQFYNLLYEIIDDQPQSKQDLNRTPLAQSSRTSNQPSTHNPILSPPSHQKSRTHNDGITNPAGSIWFLRASSAGGWSGGGTSGKGNRDKEDDESKTRRRSESITRSSNRGRTGTIAQNLNGSQADVTQNRVPSSSTPSKLMKRKSFGFLQLKKSTGTHGDALENLIVGEDPIVTERPRKGHYIGIGLGRVAGQGSGEGSDRDADEHESGSQRGEVHSTKRNRRRSFSRFLLDQGKENKVNGPSQGSLPEKEKDGSRRFMGSVRRISLVGVGKHKRTKSGNVVLITKGEGKNTFSLPSSSSRNLAVRPKVKQITTNLPYSLPPLPVTSSQLSLRLPSPSSSTVGKQGSRHSSMYDLPSVFSPVNPPAMRMVSTASNQSQISQTSVLPPSTNSSISLRNERGDGASQPIPVGPRMIGHSRNSEEAGPREKRKSTLRKRSTNTSIDFASKLSRSNSTNRDNSLSFPMVFPSSKTPTSGTSSSSPKTPSKPPPLLPPIELQPPSPPRKITKGAEISQSNVLTTIDSLPVSAGTSGHPPSGISSPSSVFITPSSPQPHPTRSGVVASPSKLHVPHSPNSKLPLQQSASLGRSTAVVGSGKDGTDSVSGSNNAGSTPFRRNSLGDLKIPARISQAQVGLRRDLGMVREFANNIDRKSFSCSTITLFCSYFYYYSRTQRNSAEL